MNNIILFLINIIYMNISVNNICKIHFSNVFRPFGINNGHWEVGMCGNEYFMNLR